MLMGKFVLLMHLSLYSAGRLSLLLRSSRLRRGHSLVRVSTERLIVELSCVCGFCVRMSFVVGGTFTAGFCPVPLMASLSMSLL